MISTAYVKIWGKIAGAVAWNDETGIGSFEFEPSFIKSGQNLSPLMMPLLGSVGRLWSFPELRRSEVFRGVPGLLADSLPDRFGNALIDTWLARNGRQPGSMNPVEKLCYIGKRGMGALEFEPALPGSRSASTKVEINEMVALASDILSTRSNFNTELSGDKQKAMADILKIGTSAGGARAKAVIAWNPDTGEVRSGQSLAPAGFSHWLLKFDGVHDNMTGLSDGYGRVEMAYHLMATACGIEMTECRLLEENGRAHFMTRRFDRTGSSEKFHMQSLCAIRHFGFDDISSYSYEQLFETVRLLKLSYRASEQIFLRMVFNVLARNCDDHTKNFAFIMTPDGKWSLAPAYDLCHTYNPNHPWVSRQALSVNGKRSNIGFDDFSKVAGMMNVRRAGELIERVNAAVKNWLVFAEKAGVDEKLVDSVKSTLITL
jgi:serine/threonine-protein kinase HipA